MSAELIKKIEASKKAALDKGTVIKLRKEEVLKTKILGESGKYDYTWYQTPTKVGIEIPYSVENKYDLHIKFSEDRVLVEFPLNKEGDKYKLDLTLFKKINRVRSKYYLRLDNIEVVMEKKTQETWNFLRRDGLGIPEAQQKNELSYPSSAKVKHNWDKFNK